MIKQDFEGMDNQKLINHAMRFIYLKILPKILYQLIREGSLTFYQLTKFSDLANLEKYLMDRSNGVMPESPQDYELQGL